MVRRLQRFRPDRSSLYHSRNRYGVFPVVKWLESLSFLFLPGQPPILLEHRDLIQCVYPLTNQLFEHLLYRSDPGSLLMHAKIDGDIPLAFVNPSSNH